MPAIGHHTIFGTQRRLGPVRERWPHPSIGEELKQALDPLVRGMREAEGPRPPRSEARHGQGKVCVRGCVPWAGTHAGSPLALDRSWQA